MKEVKVIQHNYLAYSKKEIEETSKEVCNTPPGIGWKLLSKDINIIDGVITRINISWTWERVVPSKRQNGIT